MAHFPSFNFGIKSNKPLDKEAKVSFQFSSLPLEKFGFNALIEVAFSSLVVKEQKIKERKTITVVGHFDTGASQTSLDSKIPEYLGLKSIGIKPAMTANGLINCPQYAVDLIFLNTNLKMIPNLKIGSVNLGNFNIEQAIKNHHTPNNMGLLIGRDIMSRWNIVWNGPTSTVLISD